MTAVTTGWLATSMVKAGTIITTPSHAAPPTASAGGNSTCTIWSSASWNGWGWSGTWSNRSSATRSNNPEKTGAQPEGISDNTIAVLLHALPREGGRRWRKSAGASQIG